MLTGVRIGGDGPRDAAVAAFDELDLREGDEVRSAERTAPPGLDRRPCVRSVDEAERAEIKGHLLTFAPLWRGEGGTHCAARGG